MYFTTALPALQYICMRFYPCLLCNIMQSNAENNIALIYFHVSSDIVLSFVAVCNMFQNNNSKFAEK